MSKTGFDTSGNSVTLTKGADRVIVDKGTPAERVFLKKGFKPVETKEPRSSGVQTEPTAKPGPDAEITIENTGESTGENVTIDDDSGTDGHTREGDDSGQIDRGEMGGNV